MPEPYRKVSARIWSDEAFRRLSTDAKLVFLQLLTHPHLTSLGAMRATTEGLAVELGFDLARYGNALDMVLGVGMAQIDSEACLVVIPKYLRHNPPASPNVVRSWEKLLPQLPECEILNRQLFRAARCCMERGGAWAEAFEEALGKPFRRACEKLPEAFRDTFPKSIPNLDLDPDLESKHESKSIPEDSSVGAVGPVETAAEDGANQEARNEDVPSPGERDGEGISFPLKSGDNWVPPAQLIDEIQRAFPGIDIWSELPKIRAWCISNPTKRKTRNGMPRLLHGWIARAADGRKQGYQSNNKGTNHEWDARLAFLEN